MVLAIPIVGIVLAVVQLFRKGSAWLWRMTRGHGVRRVLALAGMGGLAALLLLAWIPGRNYRPIQPGERGTQGQGLHALFSLVGGPGPLYSAQATAHHRGPAAGGGAPSVPGRPNPAPREPAGGQPAPGPASHGGGLAPSVPGPAGSLRVPHVTVPAGDAAAGDGAAGDGAAGHGAGDAAARQCSASDCAVGPAAGHPAAGDGAVCDGAADDPSSNGAAVSGPGRRTTRPEGLS